MENKKISTYDKVNSISRRLNALTFRMKEIENNNRMFIFNEEWKQLNKLSKILKKETQLLIENAINNISNMDNDMNRLQQNLHYTVKDKKFLS